MCGRAAQTCHAVSTAAKVLDGCEDETNDDHSSNSLSNSSNDNYNMSPGMTAQVFCWSNGRVEIKKRKWGLLPTHRASPQQQQQQPSSVGLHFSSNMFNARSDTLFDKFTFSKLLAKQQTCLIAVDGFFEWKAPTLKGSKKQPCYIHDKDSSFLLLAGLYDDSCFTIVTTDVCSSLSWLHSRMPLIVWDCDTLAKQWLQQTPTTRSLLKQMDQEAWNSTQSHLAWHAVTTQMNHLSFRGSAAIQPVKQPASVKSFFSATKQSPTSEKTVEGKKRALSNTQSEDAVSILPPKRRSKKTEAAKKKGSIASYFSPKST